MSDFFSKIENFLFDILGLILPGAIILLMFISPLLFIDFSKIPTESINSSVILSSLMMISKQLRLNWTAHSNTLLFIGLVSAYIIGHTVKVLSIILYNFLSAIFDKSLNKLFIGLISISKMLLGKLIPGLFRKSASISKARKYIKDFFKPLSDVINYVFSFEAPSYYPTYEGIKRNCQGIVQSKYSPNYPDNFHALYKLSGTIDNQEGMKSLSNFYLAKYNLYRSLSFIFLLTIFYYNCFFSATNKYLLPEGEKLKTSIIIILGFLWFTFHYKFKRYWTLSGDERLISLFYFLNKNKSNAS